MIPARRSAAVLLPPQVLRLLAGHPAGLVPAQVAVTAAVEVLVDLRRDEGGEELLGEPVVHRYALVLPVVLVHAHGLEADRGGDQLVCHLVVWATAPVHGVVRVAVVMVMLPEKRHKPDATRATGLKPAVPLLPEEVGLVAGHPAGLVPVEVTVAALLEVLVDLRRREPGEQLLAELVVLDDALALPVVLVHAHGLEARRARQELVAHLMVRPPAAVDVVVGVLGAEEVEKSHGPELSGLR